MTDELLQNIADAISNLGEIGVLDWFSCIISLGSLIFAILIPVRIAKKQNDIALFEKRLLLYFEVIKLCNFSKQLQDIEKLNLKESQFVVVAEKSEMIIESFNLIFLSVLSSSTINITPTINKSRMLIESVEFLYFKEIKSNFKNDTDKIFESLINLMRKSERNCFVPEDLEGFRENLDCFVLKYLDIIKEPLKM